MLLTSIKPGDWVGVRKNFQKLGSLYLGERSAQTFAELTLTSLTVSRLLSTDADKELTSVSDLTSWIAGTTNRVTVADDADGTVTLSGPQDTHVDAIPEFAGITIKDSGDNIVFYVDNDELYFTTTAIDIVTGNPMPWLFWFTYTV